MLITHCQDSTLLKLDYNKCKRKNFVRSNMQNDGRTKEQLEKDKKQEEVLVESESLKLLISKRDEAFKTWKGLEAKHAEQVNELKKMKKSVSYDSDEEDEEIVDEKPKNNPYDQKKILIDELLTKLKAAQEAYLKLEEQVAREKQELRKPKPNSTTPLTNTTLPLQPQSQSGSMLEFTETEPPVNQESNKKTTKPLKETKPEIKTNNLKKLIEKEQWDIKTKPNGWEIQTRLPPPAVITSEKENNKYKFSTNQSDHKALDALFWSTVNDLKDKGMNNISLKVSGCNEEAQKYLTKLCNENGVRVVSNLSNKSNPEKSREEPLNSTTNKDRAQAKVENEGNQSSYKPF